uniref:Kinesin motor domain-containing protein n=1 Tax=Chenopodium quinoa TaxID=63459 RepID=A0A803LFQ3_CHEQI
MASKYGSKTRKLANSASTSTTTSSKKFLKTSADCQTSPASSSVKSKNHHQYFYSESPPVETEKLKENVTVTVRFRPLSPKEIRQGEEIAWYADGETVVRSEHNPSIAYAYDRVFGPTTTTRHVYDVAAQHVVNGAMEGINGTIFAYGVTSSGKTHTMHGDQRSPGIIPLAVKDAFSIIQEVPSIPLCKELQYYIGCLKVVNDLLNPAGQNLRIREDHQHLIDLAGSESSKAETTGVRRKEGAYINKSLLTLGTVISKLTEGRSTHIPYRDSKLTRLLQSSLSGHGRVSLICTVTPASSNTEETHNTLKFAHRAKCIEIQAAQNKIIDEKSLIKKYQSEIRLLKEELEQLKKGILIVPQLKVGGEDIVLLKQKLEDGQVKLQSRLEEEEEAKAALLSRIQRLTKLILVSTKSSQSSRFSHRPGPRRRHSFGEEELAYLPHKRRDLILDDENIDLYIAHDGTAENPDDISKEKKSRKNGLLNWLKIRKKDGSLGAGSDKSSVVKSNSTPSTPQADSVNLNAESRLSQSLLTERTNSAELSPVARHDRETPEDFSGQGTPLTSTKSIDQIDLLREQKKILSGEVALHSSALKRLSEEAAKNPKEQIHMEMRKLREEIRAKNEQIASLEKQIADTVAANYDKMDNSEMSQVKIADNRIIQEQLDQKIGEVETLQGEINSLKQQLSEALESRNVNQTFSNPQQHGRMQSISEGVEMKKENRSLVNTNEKLLLRAQTTEIEELKQKLAELTETKDQLEQRNKKLAEESSYAKGLASAAAVELKALSEEVFKLMNENEKLSTEITALKNAPTQRRSVVASRNGRRESQVKRQDQGLSTSELKKELVVSKERELAYESALQERDQREAELQRKVEESKQREAYLENELANMWVLVAKLKKSQGVESDISDSASQRTDNW